jgi:hypothetical protein
LFATVVWTSIILAILKLIFKEWII